MEDGQHSQPNRSHVDADMSWGLQVDHRNLREHEGAWYHSTLVWLASFGWSMFFFVACLMIVNIFKYFPSFSVLFFLHVWSPNVCLAATMFPSYTISLALEAMLRTAVAQSRSPWWFWRPCGTGQSSLPWDDATCCRCLLSFFAPKAWTGHKWCSIWWLSPGSNTENGWPQTN